MTNEEISVRCAADGDSAVWDRFVHGSTKATFFHLFGWRRVIKSAYGYEGCYLMAERGGALIGVLPLIDVKSQILGRSLISTAFTVGGGIVADDEDASAALRDAALNEGRSRRVKYVELRSQMATLEGWTTKGDVYAGFTKSIPSSEEEHLNGLPRRRRASVKKGLLALESGALTFDLGRDVDAFYCLYAQAVRNLGTPIFPRRFVDALITEFAEAAEILVVHSDNKPALVVLTFYFGDQVMPYYFGASADARALHAYDLAIWLQMRRGAARGASVFNFGRSKIGSGSFDYKVYWGFEAKPLQYHYALIEACETPNVNPQNPKFSMASAVWRHLPLPVANLAGPFLARHLA